MVTVMYIPDNLKNLNIVLASGSPRRKELMQMLAMPFTMAPKIKVNEEYPSTLAPHAVPEFLAVKKADAYSVEMGPDDLFITADTVVIVDEKILGKPHSEAEAVEMLSLLSGRTHTVVTGVCVFTTSKRVCFSAETQVEFATIPVDEIRAYVADYKPYDKAGAYGIQEWIGAVGIRSISGSFYNVMGLPVHRLWEVPKAF